MAPSERYYKAAAERPLLIHRVCGYLRLGRGECQGCPEEISTPYGPGTRGCRLAAEEVIAIVMEDLDVRKPGEIIQDNEPRRR